MPETAWRRTFSWRSWSSRASRRRRTWCRRFSRPVSGSRPGPRRVPRRHPWRDRGIGRREDRGADPGVEGLDRWRQPLPRASAPSPRSQVGHRHRSRDQRSQGRGGPHHHLFPRRRSDPGCAGHKQAERHPPAGPRRRTGARPKGIGIRHRGGISSLPEVSLAEVSGARPYEVSIEVPVARLRALGLTLEDVALAVRQGSMELSPAGSPPAMRKSSSERWAGTTTRAIFEDIIVLTRPDGTSVRLREIATVYEGSRTPISACATTASELSASMSTAPRTRKSSR